MQNIVPKYLIDIQQGAGTIWVGTKELLPIRLEADMLIGENFWTGLHGPALHEVANPGKLRRRVGPKLFDTAIPEGYTEFKITDLLPGKFGLAGLGRPAGRRVLGRGRRRRAPPDSTARSRIPAGPAAESRAFLLALQITRIR